MSHLCSWSRDFKEFYPSFILRPKHTSKMIPRSTMSHFLKFSAFVLLLVFVEKVGCDTCEEESKVFGKTTKVCPGIFDSPDQSYCCGSKRARTCCDKDEYERTPIELPGYAVGLISFFFIAMIVACCLICFCCQSCYGYKYRHRGAVLRGPMAVGTQVQTQPMIQTYPAPLPGSYPTGAPAPAPMPYPAAPQGAYPPAPQGAYPPAPQGGYPPAPQGAYPPAPQGAYPSAPPANAPYNPSYPPPNPYPQPPPY